MTCVNVALFMFVIERTIVVLIVLLEQHVKVLTAFAISCTHKRPSHSRHECFLQFSLAVRFLGIPVIRVCSSKFKGRMVTCPSCITTTGIQNSGHAHIVFVHGPIQRRAFGPALNLEVRFGRRILQNCAQYLRLL